MLAASGGGAPLGESGGSPVSILNKLETPAHPAGEPPALKLVALELTMDKLQREIPKMMEAMQEKILASIPAKIEEQLSRSNLSEGLSAATTCVASSPPVTVPTKESEERVSRLEARLMELEARPSRGSELARCVGMMDAELEMAMIGRLDKLAAELREQMDSYDKKLASLGPELKLVHMKLNACVGDCSRLDVRMFELEQLSTKESISPRSGLKLSKPESPADPGIGRTYGSVGDLDSLASTARSTTSARSRFIEDARGAYACHRVDKEEDGRPTVGPKS